ncbi:MAG TPA: FHA domain-containing protein [Bryobacteraceae bacterium]|jgi:hypothetical protein|nr:FHA domain-containing protein [Bryobacteraceae bacterium]
MTPGNQSLSGRTSGGLQLSGNIIASELLRNMELGRFEMAYAILLPCFFTVFLNPADYAKLRGVLGIIGDDARRALRARVSELNAVPGSIGLRRGTKAQKEHRIACQEWDIEFLPDPEVPGGDVEIHSELSETATPGFCGTKTTLIGREPSVTQRIGDRPGRPPMSGTPVYAALHFEDESGPQTYLVTTNQVTVGRGGDEQAVDLVLKANPEISREHLIIRRNPATGLFTIIDASTNGTWLNGKKLRKGAEDLLPNTAQIGIAEVLTLAFEVRA